MTGVANYFTPDHVMDYYARFQWRFGRNAIGRFAIDLTAGCDSPTYRQLQWLPQSKVALAREPHGTEVDGNPAAKGVARLRSRAALVTVNRAALQALLGPDDYEALAFRPEKAWFPGIMLDKSSIFKPYDAERDAVLVRPDRGTVPYIAGSYSLQNHTFTPVSKEAFTVLDQDIAISEVKAAYPDHYVV